MDFSHSDTAKYQALDVDAAFVLLEPALPGLPASQERRVGAQETLPPL